MITDYRLEKTELEEEVKFLRIQLDGEQMAGDKVSKSDLYSQRNPTHNWENIADYNSLIVDKEKLHAEMHTQLLQEKYEYDTLHNIFQNISSTLSRIVYQVEPDSRESGIEINVKNAADMMSYSIIRLERLFALANSKNRTKLEETQIIHDNIQRVKLSQKNSEIFRPPGFLGLRNADTHELDDDFSN